MKGEMAHPRLLPWQFLCLTALAANAALLWALLSTSSDEHSHWSPSVRGRLGFPPKPQAIPDLTHARESSDWKRRPGYPHQHDHHRDCSSYPDNLTRLICRVEASVVFYTPKASPLVVAKDVSLGRYYARRDLQGWTLAYRNISFKVVELPYREPVAMQDFSVFLCLGISSQDQHCLRPSAYHLLSQGQRFNQIHGLRNYLWRKDGMCFTLREALASFRDLHNFTFPCWVLPSDKGALQVTCALCLVFLVVQTPPSHQEKWVWQN